MSLVTPKAFSHIAIKVADVDRSVAFYEKVFGFDIFYDGRKNPPTGPRQAIGVIADCAIELMQLPGESVKPAENATGIAVVSFSVEDADATLTALRGAGVTKEAAVTEIPGGMKYVLFQDPDGNTLEIIQHPRGAKSLAEVGAGWKAAAAKKANA
jgi:lactoylglutathione lyase